jgi:hypothetical protein
MKKLLVFVLLLGSTAWASRMDDILIMTEESIQYAIRVNDPNMTYEIIAQDFTKAAAERDLAIKTDLHVTNGARNRTEQWTCVTQFVKTPKFFKVSETDCK